MLVQTLPGVSSDTTLPIQRRDRLLVNDNGGVLFLADLAYPWSYPGGTPIDGAVVRDIAERGTDGSIKAGTGIAYAGGGLDFSNVTTSGNHLVIPASVAAALWGGGTGAQYFMVCIYLRLPVLAEWQTGTTPVLLPFIDWGQYTTGPDLLMLSMYHNPAGIIQVRRQTAIGVQAGCREKPAAGDYGGFAQLAYWRNASGTGSRLRTANGVVSASGVVGANNTVDFSAQTGMFGIDSGRWWDGTRAQTKGQWRAYRTWIEDLSVSGRDPVAVLDADYTRTVGRGVFS
jgi:hypothetical protein